MTDLMSRLKRETADCHQALEQALDLGRPAMAHADYIALLAGFRGFVAPWERAIAAAVPVRLRAFVQEREKTPLLDADLTFLSESRLVPELLPNCDALPRLSLLGDIFGSMYVLEGSTLGGRFIGPAMAKRFNLSERQGYAYFDPYQAHTGSMWNAFKALAVAELAEDEYDAAVGAARATFSALHAWLRPGTLGTPEQAFVASPTPLALTTPSGVSVS
jgi:heme oxygenase